MNHRDAAEAHWVIGRIVGVWGVKGWVRVYSYTRPASAIFDYQPWQINDLGEVEVREQRVVGRRLVALLGDIDTVEQAQSLLERDIRVARASLPRPRPGEFYWNDLVGLSVFNRQGECLGRVAGLLETGAHDVLDIRPERGDAVLIPFVRDHFVRSVDLDAGRIEVDWPSQWQER